MKKQKEEFREVKLKVSMQKKLEKASILQ